MRAITLIVLCAIMWFLAAKEARADISIQLGTEPEYEPQRVCWEDSKKCPSKEVKSLRCVASKQHPGKGLDGCFTVKDLEARHAGVCATPATSAPATDTVRTIALNLANVAPLTQVVLNGSVVKVFTEYSDATIKIFSEPGDYTTPPGEGMTIQAKDSLGLAHLIPSCRRVFVDVPDAPGELDFESNDNTYARARCEQPHCSGGGLHKVFINTVGASRSRIHGTIHSKALGKGRDSELVGEWSGPVPDAIKLRLTAVSFSWKGNCLYQPECSSSEACPARCPTARIPGAALDECPGTFEASTKRRAPSGEAVEHAGRCVYSCRQSETSSGFSLPTDVVFEVGVQKDTWTEKLVQVDQQFTAFASRGDRQFAVRPPIGRMKDKPSCLKDGLHTIHHVDMMAPNGAHFDFPWPPEEGRVNVAGATCNDRVSVQYFGEYQTFEPRTIALDKRGAFPLNAPSETFRHWWLGARGGPVVGRQFIDDNAPFTAGGELDVVVERRSFDSPWALALIVGDQITSHPYEPVGFVRGVDDSPTFMLNRLSALAALSRSAFSERWKVYLASGLWVSWPFKDSDYRLAGTQVGGEVEALLQFSLLRALSAHFGLAIFAPDMSRRFRAAPGSSPTFETSYAPSLAVKFGLGAWTPL